jgi:hypothetical protein
MSDNLEPVQGPGEASRGPDLTLRNAKRSSPIVPIGEAFCADSCRTSQFWG